jgi:arsenical pump membrane protein
MAASIAGDLRGALDQTWPPFILVAGLLLIGLVASSDGLFEWAGSRLARLPGGALTLYVSLMGLVAVVTVVLNLDTSVVFLTPVVLQAARQRKMAEMPLLYGVVFMSNSASLLLPGSNLTNLLVLLPEHLSGNVLVSRIWLAWLFAVVLTALLVAIWRRADIAGPLAAPAADKPLHLGVGLAAVAAATVLVLVVANPAVPVLCVGVAAVLVELTLARRPEHKAAGSGKETIDGRQAIKALSPLQLSVLFALAVVLGGVARGWGAPGRFMATADPWMSALLGAGASATVNNLPAAVLLSSRPPAHPVALLIGLDLGPNLVVTGALSAILWMRVARREGASPSALTYSKVGLVLAPLTIAAALGGLHLVVGSLG